MDVVNGRNSKNESLYSESLYERLNFEGISEKFKGPIDVLEPAPNLKVRPLEINDYDKGYLELLAQLTEVGNVPIGRFEETFRLMKKRESHFITVIEDLNSNSIIASGTLFLEKKFIHDCGSRARIEDVVVSEACRGKQLGKVIVILLMEMAKCLKCYKISLECKDENRKFYENLGFKREEGNSNFMQIRF